MKSNFAKRFGVAFIATYPPRKCGIGTFTQDLVKSLAHFFNEDVGPEAEDNLQVIAMNNLPQESYPFPPEVYFEIRDQYKEDYHDAAAFINLSPVDVVSLQHEYGIFGGPDGNHIIHLLNNLKKPVVTTLHTVLKEPSPGQEKTLRSIISLSTKLVVLAERAVDILKSVYDAPEDKIVMIPHGAPDIPFLDPSYYKDQFQAEGRRVILTFGLLSPNKGIEYAIEAMPRVVEEFPDVLYIVLGATHPEVKRIHGEHYRLSLEHRVKELGLQDHVVFHNRFVTLERLVQFLVAADIYITPYLSKEQIVSGTLAYALTCGKAIISTPYWYAEELLADERGFLVPFKDSDAIADRTLQLLRDESLRNRLRKNAYQFGRKMIWREVANSYATIFEQALIDYGRHAMPAKVRQKPLTRPSLPEIKLDHLYALTDDTGILQHATYSTPDRHHGYTTDDNARALIVATMNYKMFQNEEILKLLHIYLAFINHALDRKTNRIRNFMGYNREWLEEAGSEDSHGRTLWALGYTVCHAPDSAILSLSNRLFKNISKLSTQFTAPRAMAYSILGCLYYLKRFGGDTEVRQITSKLGHMIYDLYKNNSTDDWVWFEDIVTYANARVPQALIAIGHYLNNQDMIDMGLKSLKWLLEIQTDPHTGYLSLIGNSQWYQKDGEKSRFDQQPVEIACFIDACHQAFTVTKDEFWWQEMERAFRWFLGKNDKNQYLYDFKSGGCYDGLEPGGVNMNQGAESMLSWLYSLHLMHHVSHRGIVMPAETIVENLAIDFRNNEVGEQLPHQITQTPLE